MRIRIHGGYFDSLGAHTLTLPDVTLCAVFTVAHELTLRAVEDCTRQARFGAVKLFTDRPLRTVWDTDADCEIFSAGPFANLAEAGRFTTYELPKHITTSHALFIHHDSWIVDPAMWTGKFLHYDYIGAPWEWEQEGHRVGNSGFSLRSKRLMDFLADHPDQFPIGMPEDLTLCTKYRRRLPQFRWAPEALAHQFSVERSRATRSSFGFHGLFRVPDFLTNDEIEERYRDAPPYITESSHWHEMKAIMGQRERAA